MVTEITSKAKETFLCEKCDWKDNKNILIAYCPICKIKTKHT